MKRLAGYCVILSFIVLSGCSGAGDHQTKTYPAGEKATVDKLTFSVVDTQIFPRLGDDPKTPRVPQNRFYVIEVAVSSGAGGEILIPSLTLIDDSGKSYGELGDGSGLPHWLGLVRRISPAQTERGEILFDAPAAHYKLKLTGETDPDDVYIDLPLSFVHEQMTNEPAGPDSVTPAGPASPGAPLPSRRSK